ncbi:MAG: thioredoxin family protein [Acidimicrobiales bacterium]
MLRRRHGLAPEAATVADVDEPSLVRVIDDANFFDLTAGTWTVVEFWAPWCGPCRAFAPVFRAAARQHSGGLRFGSCNVDDNPHTASLLGVMSVPTLVVFEPSGSEAARHVGALTPRALDRVLSQLPHT